jgi:hypothetical protein
VVDSAKTASGDGSGIPSGLFLVRAHALAKFPGLTLGLTSEYISPAVGRFPLLAKDARAATPDNSGTNQVGESERKVVSVAVATRLLHWNGWLSVRGLEWGCGVAHSPRLFRRTGPPRS